MSVQNIQNHTEYEHIPAEKFAFTQLDTNIHDTKLETKSRGYFADAFLRFKKNKSSLIAACILIFLLIFALVSPIISPYTIQDKDNVYTNRPPFIASVADKGWGIFDGGAAYGSQNELSYSYWKGIAAETGMDPVLGILDTTTTYVKHRGQEKANNTYTLEINRYYETGIVYRVFKYSEFEKIMAWQNETGIQVIYPYVESKDICDIADNPNIWYQVSDGKGTPVLDENGDFIPAYSTNSGIEGMPYTSQRIEGDDGSYIYSAKKSGSLQCRICY